MSSLLERNLYFAYGSNLCSRDLQRWCNENNRRFPLLRKVTPAFLPDSALVFDHYSASRGGGTLNTVLSIGSVVPGVLFEVDEDGWGSLDAKEGAPGHYVQTGVFVLTSKGDAIPAGTYRINSDSPRRDFVQPTREYLAIVEEGYRDHGLDPAGLRAAARDGAGGQLVADFFIYGTLLPGECRHHYIRDAASSYVPAKVPGTLYDLGDYPGMRLESPDGSHVIGNIVQILPGQLPEVVKCLDRVEGFPGFEEPGSTFVRRLVGAETGDGVILLCWTYLIAEQLDPSRRITSGDWRAPRDRQC